ncbi:hypothetical protein L2Y94_05660 [Luteibacter aegosomatis]|uniref:DUF7940 domain-containing protein n=1 Tax=Luteibacter aegosomatis TaxID=2911537 RepID=UPI001FF81B8E|nr:hypothetical protein [Luteibacter aegosomatis]UPG86840.1 hypothetical protein L2Y94_05660 [Luteibacter aegosomatis]
MKLVDDARYWWKWHSTYVFAALAVLPEVWLNSPELQALLPVWLVAKIAPVIGVLGFFLRIRAQGQRIEPPKPTVPPNEEPKAP